MVTKRLSSVGLFPAVAATAESVCVAWQEGSQVWVALLDTHLEVQFTQAWDLGLGAGAFVRVYATGGQYLIAYRVGQRGVPGHMEVISVTPDNLRAPRVHVISLLDFEAWGNWPAAFGVLGLYVQSSSTILFCPFEQLGTGGWRVTGARPMPDGLWKGSIPWNQRPALEEIGRYRESGAVVVGEHPTSGVIVRTETHVRRVWRLHNTPVPDGCAVGDRIYAAFSATATWNSQAFGVQVVAVDPGDMVPRIRPSERRPWVGRAAGTPIINPMRFAGIVHGCDANGAATDSVDGPAQALVHRKPAGASVMEWSLKGFGLVFENDADPHMATASPQGGVAMSVWPEMMVGEQKAYPDFTVRRYTKGTYAPIPERATVGRHTQGNCGWCSQPFDYQDEQGNWFRADEGILTNFRAVAVDQCRWSDGRLSLVGPFPEGNGEVSMRVINARPHDEPPSPHNTGQSAWIGFDDATPHRDVNFFGVWGHVPQGIVWPPRYEGPLALPLYPLLEPTAVTITSPALSEFPMTVAASGSPALALVRCVQQLTPEGQAGTAIVVWTVNGKPVASNPAWDRDHTFRLSRGSWNLGVQLWLRGRLINATGRPRMVVVR